MKLHEQAHLDEFEVCRANLLLAAVRASQVKFAREFLSGKWGWDNKGQPKIRVQDANPQVLHLRI